MAIVVELTYDMSKALGTRRFEVERAETVRDLLERVRQHFEGSNADFDQLTRVAAVAINGVLSNHREGLRTALRDGDKVTFLKAAAGG